MKCCGDLTGEKLLIEVVRISKKQKMLQQKVFVLQHFYILRLSFYTTGD